MAKKRLELRDHTQVQVGNWKGLFNRGTEDSVPPGFFIDTLNTKFIEDEVYTRDGFTEDFELDNIVRFFIYKRLGEAQRYLILDTDGNFYDSLYPATPLITNAAFLDFSAVNFLNRAYITFHNRVTGIPGTYIYVYEGAGPGTLRFAAGAAPTGFSITAATSLNSGYIEAGTYLIAVANETESGFITMPGPDSFTEYVAPGGFKLDLSGIAVGPAGTAARRILITQAIPDYDGNQLGYEFFFLPNGRIGDNTTTTLSDINFFSSDLISSADYLFDNKALLPAGLGISIYNNRAVVWGVSGFEHYVFISRPIEIEVFDDTAGAIFLDPSEGISGVRNALDFSESLYIQTQTRTYVTVDNGSNPDTWRADAIDKDVGAEVFSVSKILDTRGASVKRFFQADPGGIYTFESGTFQDPPLTFNIEDTWKRVNKDYFNKVQLVHDAKNKLVYAAVPLDNSTDCSHLLVANYATAFNQFGFIDSKLVKWSLWLFPWDISTIATDFNDDGAVVLKVAGVAGNIYIEDFNEDLDDNIKINSYIQTHLILTMPHYIHHFGFLSLDATGVGTLAITLTGINNVKTATPPSWTLASAPNDMLRKPINFVNHKMSVKLQCNTNAGDEFRIHSLIVDCKPLWAETARV